MDQEAIVQFYDAFVDKQKQSGINERIFGLFKRLKKLGLGPDSNVLELGCGIGTMTFLLSRIVNRGNIEAVDISPESIRFASSKIQKHHVRFVVGDTVCHRPSIHPIDFITLFDVIEHIPTAFHQEMFNNIASYCADNTLILINIPSPASVEYDRIHDPSALQVIDQPLPLRHLLEVIEGAGLNLQQFQTYSIWVENDYQFLVIGKKLHYDGLLIHKKKSPLEKALGRVNRMWRKSMYRYPG